MMSAAAIIISIGAYWLASATACFWFDCRFRGYTTVGSLLFFALSGWVIWPLGIMQLIGDTKILDREISCKRDKP